MLSFYYFTIKQHFESTSDLGGECVINLQVMVNTEQYYKLQHSPDPVTSVTCAQGETALICEQHRAQ